MRPNQTNYRAESIHARQRAPRQTRQTRLHVGDVPLQYAHWHCQIRVVCGGIAFLGSIGLPQAAVRASELGLHASPVQRVI
eukprot:1422807-Pyramimonas_sp.AAC.1